MAVERFRACKNIVAQSRELGVHRRLLYKWRDRFDPIDCDEEQLQGKIRQQVCQFQFVSLRVSAAISIPELCQNAMRLNEYRSAI